MARSAEASDDDVPKAAAAPAAPVPKKPVRSKWEGEDEEDDGPVVRSPHTLDFPLQTI